VALQITILLVMWSDIVCCPLVPMGMLAVLLFFLSAMDWFLLVREVGFQVLDFVLFLKRSILIGGFLVCQDLGPFILYLLALFFSWWLMSFYKIPSFVLKNNLRKKNMESMTSCFWMIDQVFIKFLHLCWKIKFKKKTWNQPQTGGTGSSKT
jgi:hypothetical protein